MIIENIIRSQVRAHPELRLKLAKAMSKQTPFQYMYQSLSMTIFSVVALCLIIFLVSRGDYFFLFLSFALLVLLIPMIYKFWLSYVDVLIRKKGRELDSDLLFVSEYLLVSLESGMPLGNAIRNLSKIERPGGLFFKKVYTSFKTGKDLEAALEEAILHSPSNTLKILLKRLKDSLSIGVDLSDVLENFIEESSEKKIIEIKGYSKKLNPIVMMYLILGIVVPSLGVTFFILGAALVEMTPEFLKYLLILIFLVMFILQYVSYTAFKFSKSTI